MRELKDYINAIENKQISYDVIEMVIHSLNVYAHRYKKENNLEKERESYEKKEYILKVLLEPVEIHQINGNNYLVFKGENHRYHEPFNSLLDEDKIYFSENLETKRLNKFPFDGKRMVGVLGEEYCNKFYSLLVNDHYNFAPLL